MEASVECIHCGVVMTSWSAPGSPIRYYQCPFCARTHSSLYGEVFRRRAGVRVLDAPPREARAADIPMASQDDVRWARVKATAARWFARVEADEQRLAGRAVARPRRAVPAPTPEALERVPEVSPEDVVLLAPAAARKR
jgi:hypothetical protein